MKLAILLLAISLAVLSSCTTSYKTGQTPDDVYYSPTRPQEEYVQKKQPREEETSRYDDAYYEDRYLRMKVQNRNRWNDLNDWYANDYRYRYTVYQGCCFCTSSWSPYSHWNNYYNPYYNNYTIITSPKTPVYNRPRNFNLNSYTPATQDTRNYGNIKNTRSNSNSNNTYNSPRNRSSSNENPGSVLRDIFKSNDAPTRTSTTGSTTSGSTTSGSNSSSGGSAPAQAPVRRF